MNCIWLAFIMSECIYLGTSTPKVDEKKWILYKFRGNISLEILQPFNFKMHDIGTFLKKIAGIWFLENWLSLLIKLPAGPFLKAEKAKNRARSDFISVFDLSNWFIIKKIINNQIFRVRDTRKIGQDTAKAIEKVL